MVASLDIREIENRVVSSGARSSIIIRLNKRKSDVARRGRGRGLAVTWKIRAPKSGNDVGERDLAQVTETHWVSRFTTRVPQQSRRGRSLIDRSRFRRFVNFLVEGTIGQRSRQR